jgi:glycosyltransferase involved in cell wall biosynthesis
MNRSVLIVTPYFAPQNHAAVFRAYKLAKYLPAFGWKPIVLTVDVQHEYNEDPSLLDALPAEVEVVAARYIEPTLRGLRMALGGRDRTFRGLKATSVATMAKRPPVSGAPTLAQRAYHHFLSQWIHNPDPHWTWARTATRQAQRLMKERDIQLVFTTAPPYSSLLVGQALQKNGARWVADFRDPLAYTRQLSSASVRIYHRQKRIVAEALSTADAVTLAASSMSSIFSDMFGAKGANSVFIPTGIDEGIVQREDDSVASANPYLLFAGEVLPEFDTVFWEAFAAAIRRSDVRDSGIRILVVGTLSLNQPRLAPFLEKYNLHDRVEFLDQMPQRDIYELLGKSLGGLLVPGIHSRWWTNAAKMTDYIGMRKPVVAVVPDPSEARTALTRSRLGVFLDGSASERAEILSDFILRRRDLPDPDTTECERYTARRQVQSFVEIFESLAANH